jgi:hypothetical protein
MRLAEFWDSMLIVRDVDKRLFSLPPSSTFLHLRVMSRLNRLLDVRRGVHRSAHAVGALAVAITLAAAPLGAQQLVRPGTSLTATQRAVLAVVDSAMTFIQSGEMMRLSDLMTPEAQIYATTAREGAPSFRLRTAPQQRATGNRSPIIERGYHADVRVAGTMAVVWMPYDLYVDRQWSHCGVDVFTLMRDGAAWRIVNLSYTVEQPPACRVHPSGPAAGTTGTPPSK